MNRSLARRLGLAVICGVVGLILNVWRVGTIAPLLLGRIVTLPVAILYGPWFGVIAAIIQATAAQGLLKSALYILPIEALVVGTFARRGRSPLLGAVIVWTLIALALVAVPRIIGVGFTSQMVLPIALQVVVSGLVAVVIADLIATGASARRLVEQDRRPQRQIRSCTRFMRSCSWRFCRCCCSPPRPGN